MAAIVSGAGEQRASFTVDLTGEYVVTLTVSDGVDSDTDKLRVLVDVVDIDHDIRDAEYSTSLDRLVAISEQTGSLHVIDGETGEDREVALPAAPLYVSVAPAGTEAVVAHQGSISVVDLVAGTVVHSYPVPEPSPTRDVVHGGNGWAYVLFKDGDPIHCVELATGAVVLGTGIPRGTIARRHPRQPWLYLATRLVSPDFLEKQSIEMGASRPIARVRVDDFHLACGDLWFSRDGTRLFTDCGGIFRTTDAPETDLTYVGRFTENDLRSIDEAQGTIAALRGYWQDEEDDIDGQVDLYDAGSLALLRSEALPFLAIGPEYKPSHGRFLFFRADGSAYYVVLFVKGFDGQTRTALWRGTP